MPDIKAPEKQIYTILEAAPLWGVTTYQAAQRIIKRHGVQTFTKDGGIHITAAEVQRAAAARAAWRGPGRRPRQTALA